MNFIKKLFGKKSEAPVDNSRLLRAMHEIAVNDSDATRKKLYELFLDCQFYIPVPELPENLRKPDAAQSSEPIHIGLLGFPDHDGRKTTPAFTDLEALQNWDPNTPSIIIPSKPYFQMIRDTDFEQIAINPYDPIRKMLRSGGFITRKELEALADGLVPVSSPDSRLVKLEIEKGQQVLIGQPADPPSPEILQKLMDAARTVPDVEALYLAQIGFPDGELQIIIGVDVGDSSKQQYEQAIQRLGEQVQQLAPTLNFCPLNTSFGQDIKRLGRKFWGR